MTSAEERQPILFQEDEGYKVRLEGFEGPLELLLLLIRKHKYDIWDIPIGSMLEEYLAVIEAIRELDIDNAGDFLVMAATLAQIKSRMLLPSPRPDEEGEGEDPRAGLVRRLLEYERFREAAEGLGVRPLLGRDVFARDGSPAQEGIERPEPAVETSLFHLLLAFREVLREASEEFVHEVSQKRMTTQEAMTEILDRFQGLEAGQTLAFRDLFASPPSRDRIVALFMGLLELVKLRAIKVMQTTPFGEIRIAATASEDG